MVIKYTTKYNTMQKRIWKCIKEIMVYYILKIYERK